jgi:hypothetical protein
MDEICGRGISRVVASVKSDEGSRNSRPNEGKDRFGIFAV